MQTFLPYRNFQSSAQCLDYRRLGKQRLEAKQILNALRGLTFGWVNHPVTKMWRGYETALCAYYNEMVIEWEGRGYRNTMTLEQHDHEYPMPHWLTDDFVQEHRIKLMKKDPVYYGKFNWDLTLV